MQHTFNSLILFVTFLALPLCAEVEKPEPSLTYEQFIEHVPRGLQRQWMEKYSLKIAAIYNDQNLNEKTLADVGPTLRAVMVSPEGETYYLSTSLFKGDQGGHGDKIPDSQRPHFTELVAKLPDDGKKLPPANRKLLVQFRNGEAEQVRVYDRARLPDSILELLRLTHTDIGSWTLSIPAVSALETQVAKHRDTAFCVLPDRKRFITVPSSDALVIWDIATRKAVQTVSLSPRISVGNITFSPDGSLAVIASGEIGIFETHDWQSVKHLKMIRVGAVGHGLYRPRFIANGTQLMVECSVEPRLSVYDTRTWERIDGAVGIPDNTLSYVPSPRGDRALVNSKEGKLELWNVTSHKKYATLDAHDYGLAEFSPDESTLALVTWNKDKHQSTTGLWKMSTGEHIRDLIPYEYEPWESVEAMLWTTDGKHLIGALKSYYSDGRGIFLWDVKNGRQRAHLTFKDFGDGLAAIKGLALVDSGRTLIAGDAWGKIQFWNFESALKQIADFEASLDPKPETIKPAQ